MPTAAELRALARSETEALHTQLTTLPADQWTQPTCCGDWDVLDIAAHLKLGNEVHTDMVKNGLAGKLIPPWTLPEGADPHQWFQDVHQRERSQGQGHILATLPAAIEMYDAALARVTDADLQKDAWFYSGTAPLLVVISARIIDIILHASDIRRAVRVTPWFSEAGKAFCGGFGMGAIPMFFVPDLAQGAEGRITLAVQGTETLASMTSTAISLGAADGPTDASLTTDGGTWALLTWNRLSLDEALSSNLATVSGNDAVIRTMLGALRAP